MARKTKHKVSIFIFILFPHFIFAQNYNLQQDRMNEDIPLVKWIYGMSFGAYLANPNTASYYDGSHPEHNLENAIYRQHNIDRIRNQTPDIIQSFSIYQLPSDMSYNPAMQIGFFGGLQVSDHLAITAEFNYAKLTAQDKFTIETDKETFTSEPFLLIADIFGVEERIDIRLGLQYTMSTSSYIHPFIEGGLSLTDTKIEANRVNISGLTISIREPRSEYYNVRDYGIGFGGYMGFGLKMDVTETFALRMGGSVNYTTIYIGENSKARPQYTIFVRLMLNEVFTRGE